MNSTNQIPALILREVEGTVACDGRPGGRDSSTRRGVAEAQPVYWRGPGMLRRTRGGVGAMKNSADLTQASKAAINMYR